MNFSKQCKSIGLMSVLAFVALLIVPSSTQAAGVEPVCVMLLKTSSDTVIAKAGISTVNLSKGDDLKIFWFSANATAAENKNGNKVPLTGKTTKSPTSKTTYSYTFRNGSKETTCSVVVHPVERKATASTIVVQPIPLLVGGIAKRNQTVGLSYLQVLNVGLEPATISGIRLKQTGTASTDTILSVMAVDDTGVAKGQVGKAGLSPFESGEALIPITLTLKPKETRLFTLKATMSSGVSGAVGDTLKLVVSGVESRASVKGTFPIKGVTWTIGL